MDKSINLPDNMPSTDQSPVYRGKSDLRIPSLGEGMVGNVSNIGIVAASKQIIYGDTKILILDRVLDIEGLELTEEQLLFQIGGDYYIFNKDSARNFYYLLNDPKFIDSQKPIILNSIARFLSSCGAEDILEIRIDLDQFKSE